MGRRDDPDADADRPGVKDNQTGQAWYLSPGAPVHRLTQTPCCSGHHQGRVLAQPKEGENGIESQKLSYTRDFSVPSGHLVYPMQAAFQNSLDPVSSCPISQSTTQPAVGPSCLCNSMAPGLSSRRQWGGDSPPGWQPPVVCSCRAVSFSKGMENSAGYTLGPLAWKCYQPHSLGTDSTPKCSTELSHS